MATGETLFDIQSASEALESGGPGYTVLPAIIPSKIITPIRAELDQDLPWRPQYGSFINARGLTVRQAFDVLAHKLSRGDQELLTKLPALCALGNFVTNKVVQPMAETFPALTTWIPDECVIQRYPAQEGKLTFHKDLIRHTGLIAICNVIGSTQIIFRQNKESDSEFIKVKEGDILLLRGPGLNAMDSDPRPEHAVLPPENESRTSVTFRSNLYPDKVINGFCYYNWP